ncbi:hypothetical protein RO3G_14177 [Rhizopus delemar RA 99-880]|uniref:Uncharacterized protein n=1 Tax=Rhizopus delemar (strain RA 99-880 / ATCC MYA-4621 / FGSC 9543 / NRRL 43880) TaxID=246409 RepID=I1CLY6_RHIO9|nr:hypothetical protein RO3G_14177 [Rhizopus delemar RA 99-880]|eukprot:EIE89466.1 hypothetical protein RO3G_14177 [Rhizopus delemar RA 99-880]
MLKRYISDYCNRCTPGTTDPCNDEVYDMKNLTMKEILAVVSGYTSFFDDKSCSVFVQWCIRRNINFMKAAVSRKRTKTKTEKIGLVFYTL